MQLDQLKTFWNQLNFEKYPPSQRLRLKELFLIFYSIQFDWDEFNKNSNLSTLDEILSWVEELRKLAGEDQYMVFACEVLVQEVRNQVDNSVQSNMFVFSENSFELLDLLEKYQNSESPVSSTNFQGEFYSETLLCNRIELLYKIGKTAKVLVNNEFFDSATRVDRNTQIICNRVCQWIETNLGTNVNYINVYEYFLWNYESDSRSWNRPKALKEIGVRSGLLPEESFNDSSKISINDAKLVIDWVYENYQIKLSLPEKHQLEPKLITKSGSNVQVKTIITNLIFLILATGIVSFMYPPIYSIFSEPILTLREFLLKNAVLNPIPLKKRPIQELNLHKDIMKKK